MGRDADALILKSAPLVRAIALSLAKRLNGEFDDFVQSGMIGLMDAARRFDETKSRNFRVYASRRIRGAILDNFRHFDTVPRWEREKRRKDPSRAETEHWRFNSWRTQDSEWHLSKIPSGRHEGIRARRDMTALTIELLHQLPPRHRDIMYMRYFESMDDPKIGAVYGITGSRVCQLRREAEQRIRVALQSRKISSMDDVI